MGLIGRLRAALRAHGRLPVTCVSVFGPDGESLGLVTFRVTLDRDERDRLCVVPADGTSVYWTATAACVAVGFQREGRRYYLRNPRSMAAGDRLLLDRTWPVVEDPLNGLV